MNNDIIKHLIDETMLYDFPFMASEKKKREIIAKKKLHIETVYRQVASDQFPTQDIIAQIWNESVNHADESFSSLPQKMKINGFYLQELMHYYSKRLGYLLMSKDEEE